MPAAWGLCAMRRSIRCTPAKGMGQALLKHVALQARASGMARLKCPNMRTAVPFHAVFRFRTLAETRIALRGGIAFPDVTMKRQLWT